MAPINLPDGSQVSEIVLPDGSTASEVLAPDGSTVFSGTLDSLIYQTESADSTTITEAEPYSMIAVATFDGNESGDIWRATLSDSNTSQLEDKSGNIAVTSASFSALDYGSAGDSGLEIITTTFNSSRDSKIFVNGSSGGPFSSRSISPPNLDGTFYADNSYSNTWEEVLVYDTDINENGTQDGEEKRLADKYGITL